jgi:hypothetical protein
MQVGSHVETLDLAKDHLFLQLRTSLVLAVLRCFFESEGIRGLVYPGFLQPVLYTRLRQIGRVHTGRDDRTMNDF